MKRTLLTVCTTLLLGMAWPAIGAEGAKFRCGMHLGGKGMTYQPSLGWRKDEPLQWSSEAPATRSRSVVMVDRPSDMTLTVTSQEFRYLRSEDLRIQQRPLALAKAGCTWR